jgi:hypothetical protein
MGKNNEYLDVLDNYRGMGAFLQLLTKVIGIPAEKIRYFNTEYNQAKNDLFDDIHRDSIDKMGEVNFHHVPDARSEDAGPEAVLDFFGGSPDIEAMSSSCHGVSRLGKKLGFLKDPESKAIIDSSINSKKIQPRSRFVEMTSGMPESQRKIFDSLLNNDPDVTFDKDEVLKMKDEDFEDIYADLEARGMLDNETLVEGKWFSPRGDPHSIRTNFPVDDKYAGHGDYELRKPKETEFDPMLFLNQIFDDEDDIFSFVEKYGKEGLADLIKPGARFSAKKTLGRSVASISDSPSTLRNSMIKDRGGISQVLRLPKEGEVFPVDKARPKVKNEHGKLVWPQEQFYNYDPNNEFPDKDPGAVKTHSPIKNKDKKTGEVTSISYKDKLANPNTKILKPGDTYAIDKLQPRELALMMGWPAGVVKKINNGNFNSAQRLFGDAYPLQSALYIQLHNPVLWEKFPDVMQKAYEKFIRIKPSDARLKNVRARTLSAQNMKDVYYPKHIIDAISRY